MHKKSAGNYLWEAIDTLAQRGEAYDEGQERSMSKIVSVFNQLTSQDLTEQQGWAFMQVLKLVRLHSHPDRYHEDSALDSIAYSALAAESWATEHRRRLETSGGQVDL